jgi:hypothetical protein
LEDEENARDRIASELRQIAEAIEQLTGLRSRWNGEVEFAPAEARFLGMKPFDCRIVLRADLISQDVRWRTLIHESFHAVSAGYNPTDFEENVGWEEGVVEKLQRLFRVRILDRMGVSVAETVFEEESRHAFSHYLAALERIRQGMRKEEERFYRDLIEVPLRTRYASLVEEALQLRGERRKEVLASLSAAQSILKEGRHEVL